MTLILTCLTNDIIYQVSDRRLTSFSPPYAPIDEESNKAVLVDGRVVFGYTGISQIDGLRTDDWLARIASTAGLPDMAKVSRTICDQATSAFRKMNFGSQYKRQAFQGAGWFSPDGETLKPGLATIQNAINIKDGSWLPRAQREFRLDSNIYNLNHRNFVVTSIGHIVRQEERNAIYQLLRKCVHRKRNRHIAILDALALSVRWLSYRHEPNSSIGRNLMAVSLPKIAAERFAKTGDVTALAMYGGENHVTFFDMPEHGRISQFGPHFVTNGMVMSNFTYSPL